MGTRATYEIDGQVFYCHWDGYREGAAVRFANMVAAMTKPETGERKSFDAIVEARGGAAFAFIRGNADAEPAHRGSHDGHGDTEFRYRVEKHPAHGYTVAVETRRWSSPELRDWGGFGPAQPLAEFINTYGRKFDAPRVVVVEEPASYGCGFKRLATVADAREIARLYAGASDRFDDGNPNRKGYADRAAAWQRAVDAAEPEAVAA